MRIDYYRFLSQFTNFLFIQENGYGKTGLTDVYLSVWKSNSVGDKVSQIINTVTMSEINSVTEPGWYQYVQKNSSPYDDEFDFEQNYVVEYGIESYFLGIARDTEHYIIHTANFQIDQSYGTVLLQNIDNLQEGYQEIAVPQAYGYWDPSKFVAEIKTATIGGSGYTVTLDSACDFAVEMGDRIKIRDGNSGYNWETGIVDGIISTTQFTVSVSFTSIGSGISVLVYKPWSGFIIDTTPSNIANTVLDQLASIYECWRNVGDTAFQLNGGNYSDYNNDDARDLAYNNKAGTGNNTRPLESFINTVNANVGGEDYFWQAVPSAWYNANDWMDTDPTDPKPPNHPHNFPLVHSTNVIPDGEEITAMTIITMDDVWELIFDWGNNI